MPDQTPSKQLLHPVFGGEPARNIVGLFPSYASAWKARAQQTVGAAPERAR